MADNINKPKHYTEGCGIECIDAMEAVFGDSWIVAFCLCNAFKYMWRYPQKNGDEDLKKAEWYIGKAEELLREISPASPRAVAKLATTKELYRKVIEQNDWERVSEVSGKND